MLIETFFAVACDAADLRDLDYSRIAGHLSVLRDSSRPLEAGSIDASDQTETPPQDAIVSLDIKRSPLSSLAGAGAYRSLLALSITRTALSTLSCQVRRSCSNLSGAQGAVLSVPIFKLNILRNTPLSSFRALFV